MRIVRVFPYRTSMTPNDDYVRIGFPDLITCQLPPHDEVHVSITFTWDRELGRELQRYWQEFTDKPVKLGGVAFNSPAEDFIQGMYLKPNVIFTTRGCNNRCPWCIVPKQEGKLKQLEHIPVGNILQDNNILQADRQHLDKVFEMLKTQKQICFRGGLQPDLLNDYFIDGIRSLRIAELWLECDTDARFSRFADACKKLRSLGYDRHKIRCYALSMGKDMEADEARARAIWECGADPFVQLYQDFGDKKIEYSKEWKRFARMWQRPALIQAHMKEVKNAYT